MDSPQVSGRTWVSSRVAQVAAHGEDENRGAVVDVTGHCKGRFDADPAGLVHARTGHTVTADSGPSPELSDVNAVRARWSSSEV